jgi:hypothetical protein
LPSPSSSEEAGAESLLEEAPLDSGVALELETSSTLLDSGAALDETSPEQDSGVSLDAGASGTADEEVAGAISELETSSEENVPGTSTELELSGTDVSAPELESSPQATNAAVKNAHTPNRIPLPFILCNIPN